MRLIAELLVQGQTSVIAYIPAVAQPAIAMTPVNRFRISTPAIAMAAHVTSRTRLIRSHASQRPVIDPSRVVQPCNCPHAKKNTTKPPTIAAQTTTTRRKSYSLPLLSSTTHIVTQSPKHAFPANASANSRTTLGPNCVVVFAVLLFHQRHEMSRLALSVSMTLEELPKRRFVILSHKNRSGSERECRTGFRVQVLE